MTFCHIQSHFEPWSLSFLLNLLWHCSWKINEINIVLLFLICRLCDWHSQSSYSDHYPYRYSKPHQKCPLAPRWSTRKGVVELSTLDDEQNERDEDGMHQSRDDEHRRFGRWIGWRWKKMEIGMNMNIVMTERCRWTEWWRWSRLGLISIFII